jgi:hypothetical protein
MAAIEVIATDGVMQ